MDLRRAVNAGSLAVLLFALALALRIYRIDAQSLWYDEGLTIALAGKPLDTIVRAAAADVHPPLYYWLLHGWLLVSGASEAAVRALSAVCGALTVVLIMLLGRRWLGATAGWLAGIAAAVAPFSIHYSQEARMYALAALLAVCLWFALLSGLGIRDAQPGNTQAAGVVKARPLWLAGYWIVALAALFTHYFMAVLVATGATAGLMALRRRAWPAWIAAHLALAGLFLPWVWSSRERLAGWTFAKQPTDPTFILADALRVFSLGPASTPAMWPWLAGFAILLAAAALAWRRPTQPVGFITAWLLFPLGAILLLSLDQPYYKPRFLLPALPAFHLLLGAGGAALAQVIAGWWGRRAGAMTAGACGVFLVAASVAPLRNEWFDPAFQRDDYRSLARAITATARPDDAVLLIGPGQVDVFDYYFHGMQQRYLLPRFRPLAPAATVAELEQMERAHRRVYGVFYVPYEADPDGVVSNWLAARAFRAESRWYGGVELVVYELGEPGGSPREVRARFGEQLELERATVTTLDVLPGDAIRVELWWHAIAAPGRDLLLFAHLLDSEGRIVAQHDGPPAPVPASAWQSGETYRSRLAVLVPPGAAPGPYHLVLGVYDPATGKRISLPGGADVIELAP